MHIPGVWEGFLEDMSSWIIVEKIINYYCIHNIHNPSCEINLPENLPGDL